MHAPVRLVLLCVSLLAACASEPVKKPVTTQAFQSHELLQSATQRTASLVMRDNLDGLARLLDKLYRRNPTFWQGSYPSREAAVHEVMQAVRYRLALPALGQVRALDALTTAFDPNYTGDRAGALVFGLGSMLLDVWGGKTELTLLDGLNAQKLANAAYNVEVASYLLTQRKGRDGRAMILSNEINEQVSNLSFERELAKMIARLELLAALNGEHTRRSAIGAAQSLATSTLTLFLPLDTLALTP